MIRTNSERFFLDAFDTISFPLEDKHVVNEHHVIRKSYDATQKKCPHVVHFNVPRGWFETNSRHQKCYSEGGKKILGCRGLLRRVVYIYLDERYSTTFVPFPLLAASTKC